MKYAKYAMPMASDMFHLAHRGLEAQVAKKIPKIIRKTQKAAVKGEMSIRIECASSIEADYLADIFKDYGYKVTTDYLHLYIHWNEWESSI